MKISVFGSSTPQSEDPTYLEGLALGNLLGNEKYTVMTGGYTGIMEAVSRGASESGGTVIGVTCEEIEDWRPINANQWVQKELRFDSLYERLLTLVSNCDAAIALPGGPGTLAEISLSWTLMQTEAIKKKPLILVGNEWYSIFHNFFENSQPYISDDSVNLLHFAVDAQDAFDQLQKLSQMNTGHIS
ncbi:MAG: LOG family protein [Chloroflexi bacterium]|jgi:uncharacterized protein (TIGR00730 family)|nr:LOG family protein [Chloroflexota bacterium]MBT3669221.1 LOG family protein [Chloroflexota bacterium]MBT4004083.1 LOG family protein [Chloroflexota bacterium]MBT4306466.1 LOG family protein [Chloroflexota bacterium]MBT4534965.1 LOG family protein [Chloroflexota bacterium]